MGGQTEIFPVLVDQHHRIDDLFRRALDAQGDERRRAFIALRRLIAVHETAEEVLVHPRIRWVDRDGDVQARARIEEETAIKSRLVELEDLEPDSTEFADGLTQLRAIAMTHNRAEETEEFPALARGLNDSQQKHLSRRLAVVERMAPTRPHPGLALGGENILAGGFAAIVDRVHDLLARPGP
jgi:hemerythrin superfamily protein